MTKATSVNSRDNELIWIRGGALFLVVLGHALGGEAALSKFVAFPTWAANLGAWVYSFHMPLFVACAGAANALASRHKSNTDVWAAFLVKRSKRLLLPFVLFAALLHAPVLALISGEGSYVHVVSQLLLGIGGGQLWFLWMLFWLQVIYRLLSRRNLPWNWLTAFWIAANLATLVKGKFGIQNWLGWSSILQLGIWYHLGHSWPLLRQRLSGQKNYWLAGLLVATQIGLHGLSLTIPSSGDPKLTILWHVCRQLAAGTGIIAIASLVFLPCGLNPIRRALERFDNQGMRIYLWHGPLLWILAPLWLRTGWPAWGFIPVATTLALTMLPWFGNLVSTHTSSRRSQP